MSKITDVEAPSTNYVEGGEQVAQEESLQDGTSASTMIQVKRIAIGVVGVILGFIMMLPNAMMAATSLWGARVGMAASYSFIAGGIYGGLKSQPIFLLPGLVLQVLAIGVAYGFSDDGP